MIVYFNGRFIPKEEVKISPDDRGFVFADGIYEVVRSYRGRFFEFEAHLKRLIRSLREIHISFAESESLRDICEALIRDNDLKEGDATVYIQITRGAAPRKHTFPDKTTRSTVYISASAFQPPEENWKNGIKAVLVPDIRWSRCDIKATALLSNVLANQRAYQNHAQEALFVRDGAITEGSHTNFCAVFDGQLVTFPESNYILSGITRGVILKLCREIEIPFREFPVFEKDLKRADECMILGTTTEVTPVIQVDEWKVGDGTPGPVTMKLQKAFRERVSY